MYQTFYENITRQIEELYRAQDEIRGNINNIIRSRNSNIYTDFSGNSHRQFGTTTSNNQRVYIDGQPYILEYQHQYIPFNARNNWSDSSYNYSSHHYADTSGNLGGGSTPYDGYNALNFLQQFYNNVPIFPNSQQIIDGTLVGPFCQMVSPTNNRCPISLEPFENDSNVTQIRGCGHIFNSENIQAWFRSNARCPVCRYDIRDYVPYSSPTTTDPSGYPVTSEYEAETETEPSLETTTNNYEQSQNTPPSQPNPIPQNRNEERNSNPIRPLSTGANLTGMILSQLLSSVTRNRVNVNNSQYTYDPSNNEIILEGFLRAFE